MIGVVVQPSDEIVAREFFQLFKTPWEFARPAGCYEVLLCAQSEIPDVPVSLVLCFDGRELPSVARMAAAILTRQSGRWIRSEGGEIPLYGDCLTFRGEPFAGVIELSRGEPAAVAVRTENSTVVCLGFDLFGEVRHLLTSGQPAASAAIPTLELHIALLRQLITTAGLSIVEIPPVPAGCAFMACLTHDVDHPILRNHRLDHTLAGFLYRATIGSVLGLIRGRLNLQELLRNWVAVAAVPFLHCGLAPDIWRRSLSAYANVEYGLGATYFVIPFPRRPGRSPNGRIAARRAAAYEPAEIGAELRQLMAVGSEVGVHGVDAWCDRASGCAERQKITDVTGAKELGIRMHWLWFDQESPVALEEAGFSYDSTVGYNQTIGFRAGTTQAYQPLNTTRLLELPLHVMDTALFYPAHLDLAPEAARGLVSALLDQVVRFGGAVTVNWHDRSLAPERLWGGFYRWLIQELKARGAWFPTAGQAVAWFRHRRSVSFESVILEAGNLKVRLSGVETGVGPALRLRVHRPRGHGSGPAKFVDLPCQNGELAIAA